MIERDNLINTLQEAIQKLTIHKEIAIACEVIDDVLSLHDEVISHLVVLENIIQNHNLSDNYIKQFTAEIEQVLQYFPYREKNDVSFIQEQNKEHFKKSIENHFTNLDNQLQLLQFNLDFFQKLNFFKNNVVAIGANGSGKTSLSNKLKKYLPQNGVVISAQKVLIIPTFSGVSNYSNTNQKLQESQLSDKSSKVTYATGGNGNSYQTLIKVGGEFEILLDNLLAERSVKRNQFCDAFKNMGQDETVPTTKLDKALIIWNSLIQHRILECNDGINITLRSLTNDPSYPAHQMSDGEKVVLYLISHILQAPESGFIIIDEPEMYLHKTILTKLWDILELERQDCIFIYLTHDLDFATSRITAKKVWIRAFTYPESWEIENIPDNQLPESLLLELLGSRKNILFCEGEKGSIDEKIYNILFENYTITPVGDCISVINYTKSFNKLPNSTTVAVGIIDSDHHSLERLESLQKDSVFSYSVVEPENLFLDEDFLRLLATHLLVDGSKVESIKNDVILLLENEIDLQISNYITSKINYYFNGSHVTKGNTLDIVKNNYKKFTDEVTIDAWYAERKIELEKVINEKDYSKALSAFNHKGLKSIVNKHFKITDFSDRAIHLFQFNSESHDFLRRYFPLELE